MSLETTHTLIGFYKYVLILVVKLQYICSLYVVSYRVYRVNEVIPRLVQLVYEHQQLDIENLYSHVTQLVHQKAISRAACTKHKTIV